MTSFDNSYSRLVAWLKILLPLAALGILSTLFLFSRTIDPNRAIPYAKVDISKIAREQRLSNPNYAGVTKDGSAISIAASSVRPDLQNSQRITASDLRATIETPNGSQMDILAGTGTIDTGDQIATLSGKVELATTTGYRITTDDLITRLDVTEVSAPNHVSAIGPVGRLDAGSMTLQQAVGNERRYVLVFKDGVKLIYDPKD